MKRIMLLVCVLGAVVYGAAYAADEKPDMLLFTSEGCEYCERVKNEFMPGFLEEYGSHFNLHELDVGVEANLDSLYALEDRLSFPESDKEYPAVYFMGHLIEGEIPIRMRLDDLMEAYIANPDSFRAVEREVLSRDISTGFRVDHTEAKPVYMAYFYKQGCSHCGRARELAARLEEEYPFLEIDEFDIGETAGKLIAVALGMRTGVPDNRLMGTPVFFVGDDYLLSEDITADNLRSLIVSYADTGAEPVWRSFSEDELERARRKLDTLFSSFTVLAVALAGLIDGVNPCAFATIIFFISYLSMIGRSKRDILVVGASFAFAVFITYFLLGIGFSSVLRKVTDFAIVSKIIFGGTGVLCIIFGVLSIGDYFKARRGDTADMSLQLPGFLKRRIHTTIRENVRTKSFVAGAMFTGFLISLLELACTGQVYLPTITLIIKNEGVASLASLYLLLYNVCFIIPLLVVFGVVYFGVSSKHIAKTMEARVGQVKLGLAVVFFVLGGMLIFTVL